MSDQPSTAIVKSQVRQGQYGLQPQNIDEAYRVATAISKSGMCPQSLNTAEKVFVAMQTGMEAGLSAMAAVRSVVVINGLPSWKGEAALGLIRSRGTNIETGIGGEGESRFGFAKFRIGDETKEVRFSVADAKQAGLWGKGGPWTLYPNDMLVWRAVSRASKRYFSDVLMGLALAEEVADYPQDEASRAALPPPEHDPLADAILEGEVVETKAETPAPVVETKTPVQETPEKKKPGRPRTNPPPALPAPKTQDDAVRDLAARWIDTYKRGKVTQSMLERFCGVPSDQWTRDEIKKLAKAFQDLKDRVVTIDDLFEEDPPAMDDAPPMDDDAPPDFAPDDGSDGSDVLLNEPEAPRRAPRMSEADQKNLIAEFRGTVNAATALPSERQAIIAHFFTPNEMGAPGTIPTEKIQAAIDGAKKIHRALREKPDARPQSVNDWTAFMRAAIG